MRSLFLFFSILSEKSVLSLNKVGTYLNQHHKVSVDFKTQQKKDPRNTYKTQRNCLPLHRSRLEDSSLYRIMIVFGEGGAVRRTICIAEPKCRFLGEQCGIFPTKKICRVALGTVGKVGSRPSSRFFPPDSMAILPIDTCEKCRGKRRGSRHVAGSPSSYMCVRQWS